MLTRSTLAAHRFIVQHSHSSPMPGPPVLLLGASRTEVICPHFSTLLLGQSDKASATLVPAHPGHHFSSGYPHHLGNTAWCTAPTPAASSLCHMPGRALEHSVITMATRGHLSRHQVPRHCGGKASLRVAGRAALVTVPAAEARGPSAALTGMKTLLFAAIPWSKPRQQICPR